ncbi:hypothetical protein PTSG_06902 [Salpingoeca rosetta]|uniref:SH3 domain-containing protein n=1 Tax=Salpingoeca rosetta (strain ATCC 50818 / BSB-021) TaxID=946362 RepID=F2UF48_SALR5|nr:uncharacterized protein PTSG_06902 [Salpingoeca rosetta]EGD75248.1 hypothetical protein PTSG_06902 [Salpingoeca rosetta]|eukprot:XP_004992301.1 hypothetical protein PTSG_06902 [Salpingoeca rosetta]
MSGLFKKVKRRLSSAQLENMHLYYVGMPLEEFCEVSNIPQFVEKFRQEGANSTDDVCEFHKELAQSCNMGVVHKGKLSAAVRNYKAVKRKGVPMRTRTNTNQAPPGRRHSIATASDTAVAPAFKPPATPAHTASASALLDPVTPSTAGTSTSSVPGVPDALDESSGGRDDNNGMPRASYGSPLAGGGVLTIDNTGGGESHDYEEFNDSHDYEMPSDTGLYENPDPQGVLHTSTGSEGDVPVFGQPASPDEQEQQQQQQPPAPVRKRPDFVKVEPETQPLPDNPADWGNADVLRYLRENGLGDFKEIIYSNGFEGTHMLALTANQFKSKFSADRCMALEKALMDLKSRALAARDQDAAAPPPAVPSKTSSTSPSSTLSSNGGTRMANTHAARPRSNTHAGSANGNGAADAGDVRATKSANHSGSGSIGTPMTATAATTASTSASSGGAEATSSPPPPIKPRRGRPSADMSTGGDGDGDGDGEKPDDDYTKLLPKPATADTTGGTGKIVRALHTFTAQQSDQLSFNEGETLTIKDDASLWWLARNARGQEGLVPSNFVEVIMSAPTSRPTSIHHSSDGSGSGVVDKNTTPVKDEDQPWFHAQMTNRMEAERLLRAQSRVGTFMIRPSATHPNSRTLSILGKDNTIIHLKVLHDDARGFFLGGTDIYREHLADLVEYFQGTEIKVSNRDPVMLDHPCPK